MLRSDRSIVLASQPRGQLQGSGKIAHLAQSESLTPVGSTSMQPPKVSAMCGKPQAWFAFPDSSDSSTGSIRNCSSVTFPACEAV